MPKSVVLSWILAGLLAGSAPAAPAPRRPSLAKINHSLDVARDAERKKDYAAALPAYAAVLAECGDPVPRNMWHIAAKALVQSGNAYLALGRFTEAKVAYRTALDRYGKAWEDVTRQHTLRARALVGRVEEIERDLSGTPTGAPAAPIQQPVGATTKDKEPLILITDRNPGGEGGTRGFEVTTFEADQDTLIRTADSKASPDGRKVLVVGRKMSIEKPEIIPGSCWDWVDVVYGRAGFPDTKRTRTFKCPLKGGPYAAVREIQPGDWLYYVNHSFGNSEHSGIFVGWINLSSRVALILSYPGQKLQSPGRYRPYDLTSVFGVTRPGAGAR